MSSQPCSSSLRVGIAFSQKKIKQMSWLITVLQQNPNFDVIFLDLSVPFQLQGNFDVVIQKLMWDQSNELEYIREFSFQHPEVLILEHYNNLRPLNWRSETMRIFNSGQPFEVGFPKYCLLGTENYVLDSFESPLFSLEELQTEIITAGLQYPLIIKPDHACGPHSAHDMCIITDPSGLESVDFSRPVVVQEYKDHFETLIKVFNLGENTWIYLRRSLPSIGKISGYLLKSFVSFNSHDYCPTENDFIENIKGNTTIFLQEGSNLMNDDVVNQFNVDEALIKQVAERIKNQFSVEIFGFDVIVCEKSKDSFVVDINYFPSYKEVEDFPTHFETFLLERVQRHQIQDAKNNSQKIEVNG